MADLLDEIREDIRAERYQKLFTQYWMHLLGAGLLIVLAVGANKWRESYVDIRQQEAAKIFHEADMLLVDGKTEDAEALYKKIWEAERQGYSEMAGLQYASMLISNKKHTEAIAVYETIAKESGGNRALSELAMLLEAREHFTLEQFDKSKTLLTHIEKEDSPWRLSAKELRALIAYKQDDKKAAYDLFNAIKQDEFATSQMRRRTDQMLSILMKEGITS